VRIEIPYLADMHRVLFILFFNLTILACMSTSTHYEYADGSANVYVITSDSLEYIPVKPEESSTGMYSGGDPKKVAIKIEDFRNVRSLLEAAEKNHKVHIPDRIKTSGVITIISGAEKTNFILKPGCKEIIAIETALKELLQ
jgi:hypothetical protein